MAHQNCTLCQTHYLLIHLISQKNNNLFLFCFTVYEQSKNGVFNLTLDIDLESEALKADKLIKQILADKDMSLGDSKRIKENTHQFLNWLIKDVYLAAYEKNIGFTSDVCLWPKKKHAKILLEKVELLSPGLTQKLDEKKNVILPMPIKNAVYRRFHYDNNNRKDQFDIPRGNYSH